MKKLIFAAAIICAAVAAQAGNFVWKAETVNDKNDNLLSGDVTIYYKVSSASDWTTVTATMSSGKFNTQKTGSAKGTEYMSYYTITSDEVLYTSDVLTLTSHATTGFVTFDFGSKINYEKEPEPTPEPTSGLLLLLGSALLALKRKSA